MRAARFTFGGAAWLVVAGCLPTPSPDAYVGGVVVLGPPASPEAPAVVQAHAPTPAGASVELQYLGVGGWRIETPHTVLLTGPLLTRPSILEVGLGAVLEPDTAAILAALDAWQVGPLDATAAILVGHGHYDHLLDTPWMATRLAPRARILVNRTSRLQLLALANRAGLDAERVEDVSPFAASLTRDGEWVQVSRDVRILPVEGDHAPHFAGYTLYSGVRRRTSPRPPGPAADWLDGRSLAFLVDVLREDGGVGLRIYYQDAIPREPAGSLPPSMLEEAGVDLALLVPASLAETRWHPEALVENLEPRAVLVQHWESFFHPALAPAEPVIFTVLPHFLERLQRVMPCGDACIQLPLPGTRFRHRLREAQGGVGDEPSAGCCPASGQ